MYVLDTAILSHASAARKGADADVAAWLRRNGEHCFLTAVTVAELSYAGSWLLQRGDARKAADLQAWLRSVLAFHEARILPVDAGVAIRAGELLALARANGVEIAMEDAVVAAASDLHGMVVLTSNALHFAPMGVAYIDPLTALPPDVEAGA